jgi:tetratricopeptide (TPR) repeat protein
LHTNKRATGNQRDRLLREAQALARLSHPNVVAVHDVGTFGGDVFVAMEFVEGRTLRTWLREKPRSRREILEAFCAAGAGLAAAHKASLVHRDVKPDNIIVGNDGRVRVLDFGLARDATSAAGEAAVEPQAALAVPVPVDAPSPDTHDTHDLLRSSLTREGFVMGTPRFMAPEQHRGEVADERADQFSFCMSLYLALYGELPYAGTSIEEYASNVLDGRVRDLPRARGVPRWLRAVLLRGLSARPEERWPSMEVLLAQIVRDPGRTLRRALVAGGAVVAVALFLAGVVRAQRAQRLVCAGAEAKLAGAWDATTRGTMRTAFARTNRPYAAHAFERASAALDAYAAAWAGMRTSACEATRVHGEQSEELLDLRMECLDQRGRELRALTQLFSSADAELVEKAANATAALTPVATCANAAMLKAPVRLPSDPATLAKVEALRERIARGQALAQAMRDKDGLALMKPVVEEARAVGHQPTEAQALDLYGLFQWRTGDAKSAQATLQRGLLAAEGGKDDNSAALICIKLVRAIVDQQPRSAEAVFWAEHAAQWVSRLGGAVPKLEVELENLLAVVAFGKGEFAEARRHDQRRLVLAQKGLGAESAEVASALGDLAVDDYEFGELEESLRHSQNALAIEEKTLGAEHPSVGQHLINVSAVHIQLGRLEDALVEIQRAEKTLRAASLPSDPWIGMTQVNLGEILQLQGHDEEALRVWERAVGPQNDPDVLASLHSNIGSVLNDRGRYAEALVMHRKALAIAEKAFGTEHPSCGPPLLGIGLAQLGLGQTKPAVTTLERANAIGHLQPRQHGRIRLALARALDATAGDSSRVRKLMAEARADLTRAAPTHQRELAQIETWMAKHP